MLNTNTIRPDILKKGCAKCGGIIPLADNIACFTTSVYGEFIVLHDKCADFIPKPEFEGNRVSREEFQELLARYDNLQKQLDALGQEIQKKATRVLKPKENVSQVNSVPAMVIANHGCKCENCVGYKTTRQY